MTLQQLKYVSIVAKYGSFSKAAQKLYVSQPGISKMVCALEEELGITIFVRSAAGITLTAEGRQLLDMSDRLLRDADHISQYFQQDVTQTHETLSVSSQHYCFVVDALLEYQNRTDKPSYTYKLLIGQGPDVIQQVAEKVTEVGVLFISERSHKHISRTFGENDLEFHPLIHSRPYIFMHKSHPLAEKSSVSVEDLQPYPCIMYELNADSPSVLLEELLLPNFYPQKVHIVNSLYQSLQIMLTCNGYDLGTGVVSKSNWEQGIVKRPLQGFDISVSIGWICKKGHVLSQPAAKFIKYLEQFCVDVNG